MDFPTTQWTQLAHASLHGDAEAGRALEEFCASYRAPIIRVLRTRGVLENCVEDLAHDFMLHLMRHSALKKADRERGRFRQFVSGALTHFLHHDARSNQAQKRGGGVAPLCLDENLEEAAQGPNGDAGDLVLDREWAVHLIDSAVGDVEQEWTATGKAERFAALRTFLPGASQPADYEEAARLTSLSDTALRTEVSRMRKRFREFVRARVAATVPSPADVNSELAHLRQVLTHS
jgi:DNA-directed RNA polymerase specialized sigma24 family protein